MGYVFYALETTGPDPESDRITRVYARHLDHKFNGSETLDVALGTGDALVASYQMMREVESTFRGWSPAIFIGYGSLQTHERFLRNAFDAVLMNPFFTTSESNGRSDVVRHIEAAAAFDPSILRIPRRPDRSADMSMSEIARANSISCPSGPVEQEVEFSIEVCRRLHSRAPDVVSTCARFSFGASVAAFLEDEPVVVWTDFFGGRSSRKKVTSIDASEHAWKSTVYDLSIDPGELRKLSDDELSLRLAGQKKPLYSIQTRSCPLLTFLDGDMPNLGLSGAELEKRASVLREDGEFRQRLLSLTQAVTAASSAARDGKRSFRLSDTDRELRKQFHDTPWSGRAEIIAAIEDAALREKARKLLEAHIV